MLAPILLMSLLIAETPVQPIVQWKGKIKDESLMKLSPERGFITEQKDWEKLWKIWRPNEDVPKIDFKTELIIVGSAGGPNLIFMKPVLDEEGNLRYEVAATEVAGPGFGYTILKVSRKGVQKINGKPLK